MDVIVAGLRWLTALVRVWLGHPCTCPLCEHIEQTTRASAGMPARHPERIAHVLSDREEYLLANLRVTLWPAGDYIRIIEEVRRKELP